MKKSKLYDILFIIISCSVLILLMSFGYSEQLAQYSFVIALLGFIIGKNIGRITLQKEQEKNEGKKKLGLLALYDALFLIIIGSIIRYINHSGYSEQLAKFSFIIALLGYIIGKYIERITLKKELKNE